MGVDPPWNLVEYLNGKLTNQKLLRRELGGPEELELELPVESTSDDGTLVLPEAASVLLTEERARKLQPLVIVKPEQGREIREFDHYDEMDTAHFIGRKKDSDTLRQLVTDPENAVSLLYGPSGIGKSSLIRAGLIPAMKKLRWRTAVVRGFGDPAQRIPLQLSEQLLDEGELSAPLNYLQLRKELVPLLEVENSPGLVVLIDQFEDLIARTTPDQALTDVLTFLREAEAHADQMPFLRFVPVYRTDAQAILGNHWKQIGDPKHGFPYHVLEGLTPDYAAEILQKVDQTHGWNSEVNYLSIAQSLQSESASFQTGVYPPFLQIILSEAHQKGTLNSETDLTKTDVSSLIARYLQVQLQELDELEGDYRHCRKILESLSSSRGTRACLSRAELLRSTKTPEDVFDRILEEMKTRRLIRPVSSAEYEIQHDRLAEEIIAHLDDTDREAKELLEALGYYVRHFEKTGELLSSSFLHRLYLVRHRVEIPDRELVIVLLTVGKGYDDKPCLGWFFLRNRLDSTLISMVETFILEGNLAASSSRVLALRLLQHFHTLRLFQKVTNDPDVNVRRAAVGAIAQLNASEALPLLRELTKDKDKGVRQAAVNAITQFQAAEALPLLRELTKDKNRSVRQAAVDAIVQFNDFEDLELLRFLSMDDDTSIRREVVKGIVQFKDSEDLELLRDLTKDDDASVRRGAVKGIVQFKDSEDLELLRDLTKDDDTSVRREAVKGIVQFKDSEALPVLYNLTKHYDEVVRCAAAEKIVQVFNPESQAIVYELTKHNDKLVRRIAIEGLVEHKGFEDLELLQELANDTYVFVQRAAVEGIAKVKDPNSLPVLLELTKHKDEFVRRAAVEGIVKFEGPEALPALCKLAKDKNVFSRRAAIEGLTLFKDSEVLNLLYDLTNDKNVYVRVAAVEGIIQFKGSEALLILTELTNHKMDSVRRAAVKGIAQLSEPEELPILSDLIQHDDASVRHAATMGVLQSKDAEDVAFLSGLITDNDPAIQRIAVERILNFKGPELYPVLRDLIKHKDEFVRRATVDRLSQFKASNSIPLLRELTKDEDNYVRRSAVEGIAQFQAIEDLPLLRELTKDKDKGVRETAVRSLIECDPEVEIWLNENDKNFPLDVICTLDRELYQPDELKERKQ